MLRTGAHSLAVPHVAERALAARSLGAGVCTPATRKRQVNNLCTCNTQASGEIISVPATKIVR